MTDQERQIATSVNGSETIFITEEAENRASREARAARSDAMKNETDVLLDEIEKVLEDNAEEFVKSYVQKGGE